MNVIAVFQRLFNSLNRVEESVLSGAAKVSVILRSVGEAPALKKNKFKISGDKRVLDVEKYLSKLISGPLQSEGDGVNFTGKSIYLFCGSGFSPSGDQFLQVWGYTIEHRIKILFILNLTLML